MLFPEIPFSLFKTKLKDIMSVDLIYQSNVKPNMKNFLNNDRSIEESGQYERNASKHALISEQFLEFS